MSEITTSTAPARTKPFEAAPAAAGALLPAWAVDDYLANRFLYCLIGAFLVLTLADALWSGEPFLPFVAVYFERALRVLAVVGCVAVAIVGFGVIRGRHARPLAELGRQLLAILRGRDFARYCLGAMALVLFMSAFLFNKMRIPVLNPFGWDEAFMAWDRALFLGHHPWEVLQPLLGYPAVTRFIDYLYSAWVPLVFIVWLAMMAPRVTPALRAQYWLSTVLSWIAVGLVMATLLSSAGPCYYALVVPGADNPYAGLDAYLAGVDAWLPLSSSITKEFLWAVHSGALDDIGGISAMPSMHNAQAALFAAAAYRFDRRLGHVAMAYLVLIFLGSIHLGWHYALDGIVGIAAALLVWRLAGSIVRRQQDAAFTQS
jgi:hypothetical protein